MPEKVNIVKSIAETVDDIVDAVIGGRPLTRLINLLEEIGPANVARKAGVPPPGELVDRAVSEIETALRTASPPRLPRWR